MKTTWPILLALLTLSSCKFSFDKAKVEDSYGSVEEPSCDPSLIDPSQSTLSVDSPTVDADGSSVSTITFTLLNCNSQGVAGITPTFSVSGTQNSPLPCSVTDTAGMSTCTLSSTHAETKSIEATSPALIAYDPVESTGLSTSVEFTIPALELNLKACLAGAVPVLGPPLPMNAGIYLPSISPFAGSSTWYTNEPPAVHDLVGTEVDWVLVQLYDYSTSQFVDAKSAVLHRDGSITLPAGAAGGTITFDSSVLNPDYSTKYALNIIHRNHLPIGLDDTDPDNLISRTNTTIDFTLTNTEYLGQTGTTSSDPYDLVNPTTKCLRAGNFNNDFIIDSQDKTDMKTYVDALTGLDSQLNNIVLNGYFTTDMNLNGQTKLYVGGVENEDLVGVDVMTGPTTIPIPIWNNGAP